MCYENKVFMNNTICSQTTCNYEWPKIHFYLVDSWQDRCGLDFLIVQNLPNKKYEEICIICFSMSQSLQCFEWISLYNVVLKNALLLLKNEGQE